MQEQLLRKEISKMLKKRMANVKYGEKHNPFQLPCNYWEEADTNSKFFKAFKINIVEGDKTSNERVLRLRKDGFTFYVKLLGISYSSPLCIETFSKFLFVEPFETTVIIYKEIKV